MGLFDKKYCDVCGEKIGLLGNRKLEDGNLCKDCARKLSPFFSDRRRSTVEEIKQQLAYREENERNLARFNPNLVFGNNEKVYVDVNAKKFIVTRSSNWRGANPDIIDFSQVTACNTDIVENRDEIYTQDAEGNRRSYNPPRFEVEYEFNFVIQVNSPWFSQIEFELSDGNRPQSRMTDMYREYERQMYELQNLLMGNTPANATAYVQTPPVYGQPAQAYNQSAPVYTQPVQPISSSWTCASCGSLNSSKFCQGCGAPQPVKAGVFRCDKCGYTIGQGSQIPKFCPQCGDPVNFNDMQ
ncbi:MAG: DUF4428 domain-containing protein [Ruminococcus sp.]|nr:DUF4428 domain-containing protein [Ruminococcus sp.]